MKIIKPYYEVLPLAISNEAILFHIVKCGRTCYKSEKKVETVQEASDFIRRRIKEGHESILDHVSITVNFITDRGISHQIVRHRLGGYSQESTRYCNYAKDKFGGEITVIDQGFHPCSLAYKLWKETCLLCEANYLRMIGNYVPPQIARSVLPTCVKTEIKVTYDLQEWRHFLKVRTSSKAHPAIRKLAKGVLNAFNIMLLPVFEDIIPFDC